MFTLLELEQIAELMERHKVPSDPQPILWQTLNSRYSDYTPPSDRSKGASGGNDRDGPWT